MKAFMEEIILTTTTGNTGIDALLRGVIGILETVFSGHIRAYYLFGSAADGSQRQTSDIDVCLVFKSPLTPEEREKLEQIKSACSLMSPWAIDLIALDEPRLRESGHFRIKSASRLLWGNDLRSLMPELTHEEYLHHYTHAPASYFTQVLRHVEAVTFPLSYPDPLGAFYGYDQSSLPPLGKARHNIKGLVSAMCWAATILVAWQAGKRVETKSASVRMYREHIHDEWTSFLEELYEWGSIHWQYVVPEASEDHLRLRRLCAHTLAFENYYLSRYRSYLLTELGKGPLCQCFALEQLRTIHFPDETCLAAVQGLAQSNDEEVQQAAMVTFRQLDTARISP
jgi:predicted nucleotidyltransferase